jgi:hypothetical protein
VLAIERYDGLGAATTDGIDEEAAEAAVLAIERYDGFTSFSSSIERMWNGFAFSTTNRAG